MSFLKLYHNESLKAFYDAGGSEEELYWLVSSVLVRYPEHREELAVRKKLMEAIVQEVKGKVLDVGCGLGVLTFKMALREDVEKVVGIDKNREVVEFCNRLRDRITGKAEFLYGDFLEVKFREEFDFIVFLYMLHDFEEEPFLEKAFEALAPAGKIVVGDFDINGTRKRIKEFVEGNGLKIVRDIPFGSARTHGTVCKAFLMTIEGSQSVDVDERL